ncbi:MAG: DEAD/DEAH box helicase [Clostridiaceae bacterium]|jgi:superfamily II DNA/RNA helicase|nr:DEAD/DEAH box helicase [Clostridiaceae bacterium]
MAESFENMGLNPTLVIALKKENITVPTDIQQRVIPEAIKNKDIIAQSGTGTGKTLAYLLPMYQKLKAELKEMQAIVLCPTHELAVQIIRQIERLSQNSDTKLKGATIIGNVNIDRQIKKLKEKPHIIVGTPGRILELIKKRKISAHTIKTIVIDEADRLMDENNAENVKAVIKSTLKERQIIACSATIPKSVETGIMSQMEEAQVIRVEEKLSVPDTISHICFLVEKRDKIEVLRKLVRILEPHKAIVFVNNQGNEIEIFTDKLKYHGLKAEGIHGTSRKLERKKAMEDFKAGKIQLLIASDIAARGLHIEGVTHIFNIDIPEDVKAYVHRAGRSGRNGNIGMTVSIATERELQFIKKYEKELDIQIEQKSMYKGSIVEVKKVKAPKTKMPK